MNEKFETIIGVLITYLGNLDSISILPNTLDFTINPSSKAQRAWYLCVAFLITVAGPQHPDYSRAKKFLVDMRDNPEWQALTAFFLEGIGLISKEIEVVADESPDFARNLDEVALWMSQEENLQNSKEIIQKVHSLFFPESQSILRDRTAAVTALREKRTVSISKLNPDPIRNPHEEILFTANVLLTIPSASQAIKELPLSDALKRDLTDIVKEPQLYWYDHPIQIGVSPEQNEILYGLRGLDEAIAFEKKCGNVPKDAKVACLLSVSVTHAGLHRIAKLYLMEELEKGGGLENLNLYIFSESDTKVLRRILFQIAGREHLNYKNEKKWLTILGVDGEYGRHYSFLKAVAAFWQVLVDPKIRATFKIDLDQVFTQQELVEESGASAFEHFQTPLWGATGVDRWGQQVELGMIAGALVNHGDINKSLFTPDVKFPDRVPAPDEYIFFSTLPQAASTEAEMMTRYTSPQLDGVNACLQRIHVTGGTNGILIESLRRYRPFTPSFIGRAEDQAYILPHLCNKKVNLGYVHKDGLIMRHDKEAFAHEAIQSARAGKLVGDYVRILYFSEYARIITNDIFQIKEKIDPFTGCFISRIPITVVYLRFAIKAISLISQGEDEQGIEFLKIGRQRISSAVQFTEGKSSRFYKEYVREKREWNIYYDTLNMIEQALQNGDSFAMSLKKEVSELIAKLRI